MSDERVNNGKSCLITESKIKNMFSVVLLYKTASLVAEALGVASCTLRLWLQTGEQLLEEHTELNRDLSDIRLDCLMEIHEVMEDLEPELQETFKKRNKVEEINSKNVFRYNEFIMREKGNVLESIVAPKENALIDSYVFSENSLVNENYRKYVKIYRAWMRGSLAMKSINLNNIDTHSGSAKNVGLSKWLVETTDNSFRPQKIEHKVVHEGTVSLLDLQMAKEKEVERQKRQDTEQ